FKFSLWDGATVGSGSRVWPSSSPGAATASVRQGVFTVNIGDTANGYPDALSYNFTTNPVYLQVEVSTSGSSYETLSPRQLVSSSAFSQISGAVSGTGQSTVGTTTPTANGVLTVEATSSTAIPLLIRGAVSQAANLFDVRSAANTSLFSIDNNGAASIVNLLITGSSTLQNLSFLNATGLQATTTSFFATTASSTNLFASNLHVGSLSGFLKATAGAVSSALINLTSDVSGILSVANGGTGWAAIASGAIPYGNGSNALATTTTGSNGQVLALVGGVPTWTATSTLSTISGTLGVGSGGTGATSFGQGWLYTSGGTNALAASTSPTVNYITSTSTTATSTFAAGISTTRLNTTATSTLAGIVSQTIIPNGDATYDLGSPTNRFRDLYLSTASLHLESTAAETGSAKQWKFGIDTGNGQQTGTSTGFFRIQEGTAPMFYLNHAGQLGVGVTDPRARLHIQGNSWLSGFSNGTISSAGTTVTGIGTSFLYGYNKVSIGDQILANGQVRTIVSVQSNNSLTIDSAFSPALSNETFQFQQPIARFDNSAGDTKFIIGPGGSVGIGDQNPTGLLSVGAGDAFTVNAFGEVASGTWSGAAIRSGFGGTGSTTLSGILLGNGTSPVQTLKIGSGLSLTSGTLSASSSGITSLGGQTGATQTFATSTDTNLALTVTSSGNTHTFTPSWVGTLGATRGGTSIASPAAAGILLGTFSGGGWQQVATSSLGLLTSNVAEGSNQYFTNARVQTYLDSLTKGYFFATSSADFWKTQNNFFSTSSTDFWKTQNNFFATSSTDYWLTQKTTSNLAEGSNLYFTNNRVASVIAGTTTDALLEGSTNQYFTNARARSALSSTFPIQYNSTSGLFSLAFGTTTSNTWTGTQTFGNTTATNATTTSLYIGTLSGVLKATSGQVAAAIAGTDYENPLTFSYPLSRAANAISLAFSTTTNNTWSGTNTFNGNVTAVSATSTNLNTTVLGIGGTNYFTSLTGSGLLNTAGVLTLDRTGDWNGCANIMREERNPHVLSGRGR
ncbi:hypothetical protein HY970_02720, partial [Candidatus Kaiserbacteria bacterium]|nr:hypothetical protein [Candidatus Kaiserbacteria bacterium]